MPRHAQQRDLYADLGVAAGATDAEIRKSYRKLVLELHPDKQGDKSDASEFRKVQEAYEVLRDPGQRRQYDARHTQADSGYEYSDDSDDGYYQDPHARSDFDDFLRRAQEGARTYNFTAWENEQRRAWAEYQQHEARQRRDWQKRQEREAEERADRIANERRRWAEAADLRRARAADEKLLNTQREEEARDNVIAQEDKVHEKFTQKKKTKQAISRKNCTCKGCHDRFVREQNEKEQKKKDPEGYAERIKIRMAIALRKRKEATKQAQQDAQRQEEERRAAEEAAEQLKQAQEKAATEEAARERLRDQAAEQEAREKQQAAAKDAANRHRLQELAELEAEKAAERAANRAKRVEERKAKEAEELKARKAAEREAAEEAHRLAEQQARKASRREAAKRRAKEVAEQKAREAEEKRLKEMADREAKEAEERMAREAADRRAKEITHQKAKDAAEQKAQKAAELKAREEKPREARTAEERKAREAAEERITREAEELKLREAQERAADEAARRLLDEEAQAKLKAEDVASRAPGVSGRVKQQQRARETAGQYAREEVEQKTAEQAASRRDDGEVNKREAQEVGNDVTEQRADEEAARRREKRLGKLHPKHNFGEQSKMSGYQPVQEAPDQNPMRDVIQNATGTAELDTKTAAERQTSDGSKLKSTEALEDRRANVRCKHGKHCKYLANGTCVYRHEGPTITKEVLVNSEPAERYSPASPNAKSKEVADELPQADGHQRSKTRCKFGKNCKHLAHGTCIYRHHDDELANTSSVGPTASDRAQPQPPQALSSEVPTKAKSPLKPDMQGFLADMQKINARFPEFAGGWVTSTKPTNTTNGDAGESANHAPAPLAEEENAPPILIENLSQAAKLRLSSNYIQTTKEGAILKLLEEGKHVPVEGIVVDLGWANAGPAPLCFFCKFKKLKYSFRSSQGHAVACGRCKKSSSTVTPEDEAVLMNEE